MTAGRRLVAVMLLAAACTPAGVGGDGETSSPPDADPPPSAITLPVIATESGPGAATDATFLAGMRLAAGERGDIALDVRDDRGDPVTAHGLLLEALDEDPAAVLVAGPAEPVIRARAEVQASGVPVILLGGDAYTPRRLYREVFMTSVPLLWQARVLARYLVVDRGASGILAVVEPGPTAPAQRRAIREGLAEEGAAAEGYVGLGTPGLGRRVRGADAVVFLGSAAGVDRVAAWIRPGTRLALSAEALSPEAGDGLPVGAVAAYPYTWAGWAEPIPRVARLRADLGREDPGFAQEGFDAISVVAAGLDHGARGAALVTWLERNRATFSGLPVVLGPDDHTFIDDSQLGLFVVVGPDDEAEPWVTDPPRWRPIMRTFTYDGEKTVVLDRDKRIFFPRWRKPAPSPKYRRSRFGIASGPSDPRY